MPPIPKEHDPTYASWLALAESRGMTVEQLFESMYPGQTTGVSFGDYQRTPTPQTPAQPAGAPAPAAPAAGIGMYEGQRFDPGRPWNVPSALSWGAEQLAGNTLEMRINWMQNDMNDAHQRLAEAQAANSSTQIEYYTNRVLQLRQDYQQVVQQAQTGATGYHAAQLAATSGMYLSGLEGLRSEVPTGFNIDAPLVLSEPSGIVPGYGEQIAAPVTPAAAQTPATQPSPGLAQRGGMGMYNPAQQLGATAPVPYTGTQIPATQPSPGLAQRGGLGMFNPGSPLAPATPDIPTTKSGGSWDMVRSPQFTADRPRGFTNYQAMAAATAQRDAAMGFDREKGRAGLTYSPYEMQGVMKEITGADMSSPTALTSYLGGGRTESGAARSRDTIQTVDLGQGMQNYRVRRDAYGNVTSYTPT